MDPQQDSNKKVSLPSEVENVYALFEDFHIEKKPIKSKIVNNPFNNKFLKRRKRKIAINYTIPQCKEILAELKIKTKPTQIIEQKESKLITDITERMAKVWNDNGYRELELKQLIAKGNSNLSKPNNKSQSCERSPEDNTESTHPQVSNQTCARQALYDYCDSSVTELAAYLDETLFIPRKMSFMAEMMYT